MMMDGFKRRTRLWTRGCMLYDFIPNRPEVRLRPSMQCFAEVMQRSTSIQKMVVASVNEGTPELYVASILMRVCYSPTGRFDY